MREERMIPRFTMLTMVVLLICGIAIAAPTRGPARA
jgi:hypothetical protein